MSGIASRANGRRLVAAAAGASAVASTLTGTFVLATASPAAATPAVGQDVNNDWGQSAAEVNEEVNLAVDADARVIAARTRYLDALSAYATVKQVQRRSAAAYKAARRTKKISDDVRTARTLVVVNHRVFLAAKQVAASQLAMAHLVDAVSAAVRGQHYVQAPYVAPPSAPTGLATVGATGQVSLTWTPTAGASGYLVLRDGVLIATTSTAALLDSGLDDGTPYGYVVVATNVAGWSPPSATMVGTPTAAAPAAPPTVTAAPGDGSAGLSWPAVPSATGYQVFRDGQLVGSPVVPSFLDTGLVNGTSYGYTVKALNGSSASGPSALVSCTPVAGAPDAPTNLVATPGDALVSLTWTASPGATSYTVFRGVTPLATLSGTTYADHTVSNGTPYTYTVVAYRQNSSASAPSSPATATPAAPPLSTPTGLAATPGDGTVSLTWGTVVGALHYDVYRGGVKLGSPVSPNWTDSTGVNGQQYSYTVVAVGSASTSSPSAAVLATPQTAAAGAPTGLSGTAGDRTASLTWTTVSGATTYNVYRDGVKIASPSATSYLDSSLTNGTTYSYSVTAVMSGVESAASATVQVTPFVLTPTAPSGLVATPGNAQVALSWTASANATGYRVYRGTTLVSTQSGTSFTDTMLTNGTTYSWTVVATNGTASSGASSPTSATPLAPAPGAPSGLVATPGNAQVALSWGAVATATSYRVYRNGAAVATVPTTGFTDTGLANGTAYTYTVTAVAATTEGAPSTSVVATPVKPPVNGTFTGAVASIANAHGTLQVVITVTNNVITVSKGTLLTHDSTETVSINKTAIPQYDTKAVAASSTNFTKVSGATLTWAAYKTSLQSALTQAGL